MVTKKPAGAAKVTPMPDRLGAQEGDNPLRLTGKTGEERERAWKAREEFYRSEVDRLSDELKACYSRSDALEDELDAVFRMLDPRARADFLKRLCEANPDVYVSGTEVAKRLGCSASTIANWRARKGKQSLTARNKELRGTEVSRRSPPVFLARDLIPIIKDWVASDQFQRLVKEYEELCKRRRA